MNEENKTFAEQVVEPTESERIRERITNYKAQISPQSVQIAQLLLEQQLKAGLVKSTDLDALIMLRDELNKSTIDYRTMLESSQRRLQQLAEEEQIADKERELSWFHEAFVCTPRTTSLVGAHEHGLVVELGQWPARGRHPPPFRAASD